MQKTAHVNRKNADLHKIGQRLAEERKRLGYNQKDFGALGKAALRTVIDWEKGKTSPNSSFLAAIAEIGADILYIVTGKREKETLEPRENALIDNYRNSDEKDKKVIEQIAYTTSQPEEVKKDISQENRKQA